MIIDCAVDVLVEARTFGGVDNIQTWLELFTQKAAFKEKVTRIGIIRDAERSTADSAFQSVQHALQRAKLPVPSKMCSLEGSPLAVGVFILPNCQGSGMLEDLCLAAAEEAERLRPDAVLPCVDAFFVCLAKLGLKPANTAKARFSRICAWA